MMDKRVYQTPEYRMLHRLRQRMHYLFLLMLIVGFSSCKHRTFERPGETYPLRVKFDWRYAPQATPAQMSLYLFPINGKTGASIGEPIRFDMANKDGEVIRVAPGYYQVVALNSDVSGTYMRGDAYKNFHITTNEKTNLRVNFNVAGSTKVLKVPRANGTQEEKVVEVADIIYSARLERFEVTGALNNGAMQELILEPRKTTTTIDVEVEEVVNGEYITSYGVSLSGLSNSIYLSGPTSSKTQVIVPFTGEPDGDGMKATVETFGASRELSSPQHKLVVYVTMTNGEYLYSIPDHVVVTQQIQNAPDPLHIKIKIPLLRFPAPIHPSGQLVTVENWKEVTVPLNM